MEKKANPIAILILGICSIVFAGPVGLILSIIAMVMSKKADLTDANIAALKLGMEYEG